MPWREDDEGVLLDPELPAAVQGSPEEYHRWELCAGIASRLSGLPPAHGETQWFARQLYESGIPTDDVTEARIQARGRDGEWIDMPDIPRPLPERLRPAPASPGAQVTLADIRHLGLDKPPLPTPATLKVLGGHVSTAQRYYLKKQPDGARPAHPVYRKERAKRHDKIVGAHLADALVNVVGPNDPLVAKLRGGGGLTPEEKVRVREAAFEKRHGAQPDALFMAGGPASGKSTLLKNNPELMPGDFGNRAVRIDADEIKKGLPEYRRLRKMGDHYAASAVHLESGDVAERLRRESVQLGLDMVIDGTGNSEPGAFMRQLQDHRDKGYDVRVIYANVPTDEAVVRSVERAEREGRFVPIPVVERLHRSVSKTFNDEIQNLDWLQSLDVYEHDVHIGTRFAGKFVDLVPPRMQDFREKADG